MIGNEAGEIRIASAVPRRTFLLGLGAFSVLAVTACQPNAIPPIPVGASGSGGTSGPAATPATTTAPPSPIPSDPLVRSAWTPLVGQTVTLVGSAGSAQAVLDGIDDLGTTPDHERSFALRFRGTAGQARLESVDQVRSATMGQRAIGASPTDRGLDHQWYQAIVFNPSV